MEGSFNLLLDKGTLQEAIANDRRITSRNIFKWIDQVLNVLLVYHRSFMSVGEFGLLDVSIGYSKQLKDLVAFEESLLAVLKANHNAVEALKVKNSVAERELIEDERIATLDFKRRILLHQSKLSEAAKHQELVVRSETTTATEKRALPRGFLSSKLLKFDYKHDNNVCIP